MYNTCKRSLQFALGVGPYLLALTGSGLALADQARGLEPLSGALRAELTVPSPLIWPEQPLRLRFTLVNTTDELITIPIAQSLDRASGVALPDELVFGTPEVPSLFVIYSDDAPIAVKPPSSASDEEESRPPGSLRIAARGTLGLDLDLRAHCPLTRYPGTYRVEWRPRGGQLETAAARFKIEARQDAILVTDYGKITFVLDYERAPRNVANFLELAEQGFYDGKTFHCIVPGGWLQGGCPKGDGTGMRPDGKTVPAEISDAPIEAGTLLMARKQSDPDSASCQFLIALSAREELDIGYTVIGQASDEASQRTLRRLGELPIDRIYRPREKTKINSIKLIPVEQPQVRRLELRGGDTMPPKNSQPSSRSEADARKRP